MSQTTKKTGDLMERKVTVVTKNGEKIKINYLISDSGGQGDVYHVTLNGKNYAMKWYCKSPEDVIGGDQYGTIMGIHGEAKKPSDKFIWPLIVVTEQDPKPGKRFGYLMELLPDGYYEMLDFLRMDGDEKAVRFQSYNAMLVAGMNIAAAMQKLHLRGLSYKDLNPKNFMFHPATGDVLVVDNDNVSVDGKPCSVKGTKGYMAPEIPRSKYQKSPTRETDFFSLAVILYRLFFVDHPMEGKLWEKVAVCTDGAEDFLYAIKPVFHFDPKNNTNRPTDVFAPNALIRWKAMPQELKALFITSFTEGIDQPGKRLPENAWISTIAKTRDKLIRVVFAPGDQREQFVNFEDSRSVPNRCLGLKIGSNRIALYPQKAIYEISVDGNVHNYGKMLAGITYNKQLDSLMIRNMSDEIWRGYSPRTKQLTNVGKGQEYPIFPGVMIEFHKENPRIIGEIFNAKQ